MDAYGRRAGIWPALVRGRLELRRETASRSMERDFDRIGAEVEELADLADRKVRPVTKRDQLAVAFVKTSNGAPQNHPRDDSVLHRLGTWDLGKLLHRYLRQPGQAGDHSSCDSDQPFDGLPLRSVVASPVAHGALERLARHILSIGAVSNAVRNIRIDAANERLRAGQRIA